MNDSEAEYQNPSEPAGDEMVSIAIDLILTYQAFDITDLDPEPLDSALRAFDLIPGADQVVNLIAAQKFRDHLRVPQDPRLRGKILQALHTGKVVALTGDIGSGKSTFAGELYDALRKTHTKPLYINGDAIRTLQNSNIESLADTYRRVLTRELEREVMNDKGGYTNHFLRYLSEESELFRGVQSAERVLGTEFSDREHNSEDVRWFFSRVQKWREQDKGLVVDQLAQYLSARHRKFAILLDNWDGFNFDEMAALGGAVAGTRLRLGGAASLMFFLRPPAERALLDAVQFSISAERARIGGLTARVLSKRIEFAYSETLRDELFAAARVLVDAIEADPNQYDQFALELELAGRDLSQLYSETERTEMEYVEARDFTIVNHSAIEVVAKWHNNNIREVSQSMRSYHEEHALESDRSTAVLRHILSYRSGTSDSLHEDLRLLIPDVDIIHGGLLHLRWRLLQYMVRHPDKAFSVAKLHDAFSHFEADSRPILASLEHLEIRTGLETGLVRRDLYQDEPVFSVLPAGQWFASGICHTVEYMFMLALADPRAKQFDRGLRELSSYPDQERAEISAKYVADQLLLDFQVEHPYLREEFEVGEMSIDDHGRLKEFASLFGYGAYRGWFLSRFRRTLSSFCRRDSVEVDEGLLIAIARIDDSIARLDRAAREAGIQNGSQA